MKRIRTTSLASSAILLVLLAGAAWARPVVNGATIETRTFNDCPISTLSTTNNYPASVEITDAMDPLCVGFANLHSFSFSEDGGATAAVFNNNSNFHFGADFKIEGAGEGEGGLRLSPWYGQYVDGRFMANATTGEIACFGGAVPFYSFTTNHGITYTKGTTIHLEETYVAHDLSSVHPATIQYRVVYNNNIYDSPVLPFGEQNEAECVHGLWGMLNDGRVGGYFQPRANSGASLTARWSNIFYEQVPANGTPLANGATIETRTFNDCPISTLSTSNSYPASVSITDVMDPLCVGFANLHSFSFSEDGGATAARFDNNAVFTFGADFKIEGAGEGEGGLRLSPWYGQYVDGRFMANATTGEIACFGGAVPFYSFTTNHGITYTKGTTIRLEETYNGHENTSTNPATIQYRVIYNSNTYDSPVLPFGEQNEAECVHGLWGNLLDGRAGGYFQPRANTGASLTATWSNITYSQCLVEASLTVLPSTLNLNGKGKWVTAVIEPVPPATVADIDVSSVELNGVGVDPAAPVSVGDADSDGNPDLTLKFSRSAVAATLSPGNAVTVTATGSVGKGCFRASTTIKVKSSTLPAPQAGSVLAQGQHVDLIWASEPDVATVSVIRTVDDGAHWTVDADGVPNSGGYRWTVPSEPTQQARVAVAQIHSNDAGGLVAQVEVTESATFEISSGIVGVGTVTASFALGRVAPNPAGGPFDVSFTLPQASPASLTLFDVSGRRVAQREVGGLGAGLHVVRIGDREALRPGYYRLRLSQGARILTAPVLIVP
ncbi:MAG TPA: T9SS type A sorting domain-containing protein [Candidatus Eisenbacteria bacterium]|jgi:hypothetical protein